LQFQEQLPLLVSFDQETFVPLHKLFFDFQKTMDAYRTDIR
jgi:hypothetical protein